MADKWVVTSAWPFVNHMPHLGNFVGSLLSADVFARYRRLRGDDVLYVTGSDQHGTPVEVEAIKRGVDPETLADENHERLVEALESFDISTDNYTKTHNPVHTVFVRQFYREVYENGYIFDQEETQLYCETDGIFLPDRFVEGTCPHCGYEEADGDQCESCKRLLEPTELIGPRCSVCGETPASRKTRHWYFDMPRLEDFVLNLVEGSETLSENAKTFSLRMIRDGLEARSLTRDNEWGIPAPFPGAEGKTIYVWFENVLGYVSAVVEYFKKKDGEGTWKDYWLDSETDVAFFIGKDNIPFHTVIFPSLLEANGADYSNRFHVGATEFLMFEGEKFSKSRRVGIWLDEALEILPSDYWRFSLMLQRPEVRDTNFSWDYLERSINDELNDQLGNLAHRLLTLIDSHFDGQVPAGGNLTESQEELLTSTEETRGEVERQFRRFRLQRALTAVMNLLRECNSLLNEEEPWIAVKEDAQSAGRTLYATLYALRGASVMLLPFVPRSAKKLLSYLGYEEEVEWRLIDSELPEGRSIASDFEPLFEKVSSDDLKDRLEEVRSTPKQREVVSEN